MANEVGLTQPRPSTAKKFLQNWFPMPGSPKTVIPNLVVVAILCIILAPLWNWAVTDAVWTGTQADCRRDGAGACWAYVNEKFQFFIFGFYPLEMQWRPAVATFILIGLAGVSAVPRFWRPNLLGAWVVAILVVVWLMGGGIGLPQVSTNLWSGLPITVMLTTFALVFGFPLGILLALGRQSDLPLIRVCCTGWIEVIRGIPLICILFISNVLLPFLIPDGISLDKLIRVQAAFIFFASAYIAEVVRGGLQAVPDGQREAAKSLGFGYWSSTLLIVVPQALRLVIPSLVNTAIAFFKDTSLIVVIGLFDLLGTVRASSKDGEWLGHAAEGYLVAALIYFVFCYSFSRIGWFLESADVSKKLNRSGQSSGKGKAEVATSSPSATNS